MTMMLFRNRENEEEIRRHTTSRPPIMWFIFFWSEKRHLLLEQCFCFDSKKGNLWREKRWDKKTWKNFIEFNTTTRRKVMCLKMMIVEDSSKKWCGSLLVVDDYYYTTWDIFMGSGIISQLISPHHLFMSFYLSCHFFQLQKDQIFFSSHNNHTIDPLKREASFDSSHEQRWAGIRRKKRKHHDLRVESLKP